MDKILIVEDNAFNWDMLTQRLQRRGYTTVVAQDGQAALEMARSEHPDLILMDISLPVLDGLEATRRLKADSDLCTIPVIALTAHALKGDRETALEAGCNDYHAKPVELDRLIEQMQALLTSTP